MTMMAHNQLRAIVAYPYPFPPEHRLKWAQIVAWIPSGSLVIPILRLHELQDAYGGDLDITDVDGDLLLQLRINSEFMVQPEVRTLQMALGGLKIFSVPQPQNWYELALSSGQLIPEDEQPSLYYRKEILGDLETMITAQVMVAILRLAFKMGLNI